MKTLFSWFRHNQQSSKVNDDKAEGSQEALKTNDRVNRVDCESFLALPETNLDLTNSVYPPPDAPLSAFTVEDLLQSQGKLIRELMWAVTLDISEKNRLLLPVIKNLAAFVHLLPASQSHHHNGRGGLFRHSLETAFYAVNIAKNRLMDVNANPADNYHNQPRWFLAIAIAGLMHDVGKCLTDMTITAPKAKRPWMPTIESLSEWLNTNQLSDFYCTWNLNRIQRQHECAGATLYPLLIPLETREYLEESFSTKLKNELFEALVGIRREGGEIASAVARADIISTKKDIARQLRAGFHPGVNTPVVVWLEKIMQELIEKGTWVPNVIDSPLWVTEKGVFLVWHRSIKTIQARVAKGDFPTMPIDPAVWEDKLQQSSLVESRFLNYEDETDLKIRQTQWRILPLPELEHDTKSLSDPGESSNLNFLTALKLTENSLLFSNVGKPAPVIVFLEGEPLSEKEKKIWMQTTTHPMTVFTSKEEFHHLNTPHYTDQEVSEILRSTFDYDDSNEDFVIPDENGFISKRLPYPEVPLDTLLKSQEQKNAIEEMTPPTQMNKDHDSTVEQNSSSPLTEDDLLSPAQKAARANKKAKKKVALEVSSDKKEKTIHTDTHTYTHAHTHTYTDTQPSTENPVVHEESTYPSREQKNEGKTKNDTLETVIAEIKVQLQAGSGTLVENLLFRDDRIYSSTQTIERHLNALGIEFMVFIDKVHAFQTEPILYLTDNRDYVYIERNPS